MAAILPASLAAPTAVMTEELGREEDMEDQVIAPWENLPPELLVMIFSYLDDTDKESVEAACLPWQNACNTPSLWKSQYFFFTGDNSVQLVHQGCRTVERKGSYLRHVTVKIGYPSLTQSWIMSHCVRQLLEFLARHPSAQHIETFKVDKLNFFTQWRFFTLSKRNILVGLNNFLASQRRLKVVDFSSCRLSADDGMRLLRALHISLSRHCIRHIDLHEFFQRKYSATSGSRFTHLVTSSFSSLQEFGVDAKHIDDFFLLTLTQKSSARLSLRKLKIYYEMFKCPKACISEKCWESVRRACPDLNASFSFSGWLAFQGVKKVLVPSVPLTECIILWPRVYRQQTDRREDLAATISRITQLYSSILERFCLRSDIRPYHDLEIELIKSAALCRRLREFKVTLRISPNAANAIRERLGQRSPGVDFRLVQRKVSDNLPRLRPRKKRVSSVVNGTQS